MPRPLKQDFITGNTFLILIKCNKKLVYSKTPRITPLASLKDLIVKEFKIVKNEMQTARHDIKSSDTRILTLDKKIDVKKNVATVQQEVKGTGENVTCLEKQVKQLEKVIKQIEGNYDDLAEELEETHLSAENMEFFLKNNIRFRGGK